MTSDLQAVLAATVDADDEATEPEVAEAAAGSPAARATAALDAHFVARSRSSGGGYATDWNRASSLGDLCDRKLTYARVLPQPAGWVSPWLQQIFDDGIEQEQYWQRVLLAAGFRVDAGQQKLEWPEKRIRGHIDGRVALPSGEQFVFEHKRLDANAWRGIRSWADFLDSPIYRHYPAQLGIYLLMHGTPHGLFLLTAQGHYRWLDFSLDEPAALDYVEAAIQQAERVNAAVEEGTLPDRLLDPTPCGLCQWAHLCLPDVVARQEGETEVIESEVLEKLLAVREVHEAARKAYEKADKAAKAILKGKPHARCGPWEIDGKAIVSRRVDTTAMPDAVRKQYEVEQESWRVTIRRGEE